MQPPLVRTDGGAPEVDMWIAKLRLIIFKKEVNFFIIESGGCGETLDMFYECMADSSLYCMQLPNSYEPEHNTLFLQEREEEVRNKEQYTWGNKIAKTS